MHRILTDSARRKQTSKHGGDLRRTALDADAAAPGGLSDDLLRVDEALEKLEAEHQELAKVAKLRDFAGMSVPEAAAMLELSRRSADRLWRAARAWLLQEMARPKP